MLGSGKLKWPFFSLLTLVQYPSGACCVLRPALSEGVPVQSAVPDGSASEGAACGDINKAVIK